MGQQPKLTGGIPSTNPWVAKLREAMFDAVTEADIQAIVKHLVEKAKKGDPAALKMVFEYLLGGPKGPVTMTQNNLYLDPPAERPRTTDECEAVIQQRRMNGHGVR
jgi:hypothetical protein